MSDYKEEFVEEGGIVRYKRTMPLAPKGTVTVEVFLTKDYIDKTEKRVIESYLNHCVSAILTREGVH